MAEPMNEREALRRWAETWKEVAPRLEEIHRREIQEADNLRVLALLEEAFNQALKLPPRLSSGLVEMQKLLAKLPH